MLEAQHSPVMDHKKWLLIERIFKWGPKRLPLGVHVKNYAEMIERSQELREEKEGTQGSSVRVYLWKMPPRCVIWKGMNALNAA